MTIVDIRNNKTLQESFYRAEPRASTICFANGSITEVYDLRIFESFLVIVVSQSVHMFRQNYHYQVDHLHIQSLQPIAVSFLRIFLFILVVDLVTA